MKSVNRSPRQRFWPINFILFLIRVCSNETKEHNREIHFIFFYRYLVEQNRLHKLDINSVLLLLCVVWKLYWTVVLYRGCAIQFIHYFGYIFWNGNWSSFFESLRCKLSSICWMICELCVKTIVTCVEICLKFAMKNFWRVNSLFNMNEWIVLFQVAHSMKDDKSYFFGQISFSFFQKLIYIQFFLNEIVLFRCSEKWMNQTFF